MAFILKVKQPYLDFITSLSLDRNINTKKSVYVKDITSVKDSKLPHFELTNQRKEARVFVDSYLKKFRKRFYFMKIERLLLPRYYLQLCVDDINLFDQMVYLNFDKAENKYFIGRCDDESGVYQVKFTQKEIMALPFQKQIFRKIKANEEED